ncbi:MAG TPA: TonB family protein [Vicinamibacterales bacterium]|jgi:TonB family protein
MTGISILAAALVAGTVLAAQDDPLGTARDLYSSAAYEEALEELTRAEGGAPTPAVSRDMMVYRAFCLVALSRGAEAEMLAESLIRQDPLFTLDKYRDASPRIASLFASVRARVLPEVIWEEYRSARTLAAARAPDAALHLAHVRQVLDEAQKIGAWDKTLAELQLLVDGFIELSREAEPAAAAPLEKATALDEPAPSDSVLASAASIVARAGDAGVVSPIVIVQTMPQAPPALFDLMRLLHRTGTIDIVIDERGAVEDVTVRQSVNAAYDSLLVAAARTWRYQPARKDGVPVRFVKTVTINVQAP